MLCTKLFLILVIYGDNFRNIFLLLECYFILSKYIIHHLIDSPHVDWHDTEMWKCDNFVSRQEVSICCGRLLLVLPFCFSIISSSLTMAAASHIAAASIAGPSPLIYSEPREGNKIECEGGSTI